MNKKLLPLILIFAMLISACNCCRERDAKYVFYFIGDGMGFSHVSIAEAYQNYEPLSFTQFPVLGMATTYSSSNNITCSSAAGTALSTGYKTNNGFLGVTPDTIDLKSISYKIHEKGIPVGIMTSVQIDHATPAAFYAHNTNRNDYYSIASELPTSGFEFFGGGGFINPTGKQKDKPSLYDLVESQGYTIASGLDDFNAKKENSEKIILLQEEGRESGALPYVIDRKENDLKLSEIVSSAIEYLENEKGFFIMAEGGRIDWGAHSNDAKATILETLDLSEAVAVAYNFYKKHPDNTLIVVTADHETGGFAFGRTSGYKVFFDKLGPQSVSKDSKQDPNIDKYNEEAHLGWTTPSHTGGAVPVFAIGTHSSSFAGRMDNTDIPKKICAAMGIDF